MPLQSRFWRKTRSTGESTITQICPGVDGNRNYNFRFGTVGSNHYACSDVYCGSKAFSEVETRVVRDILQENLSRVALYVTMHSFASVILYPWAHDGSRSHNIFDLHSVGVEMASAIHRKSVPDFPKYIVGNSALVLNYLASGTSIDYAHSIGVNLTYAFELPGISEDLEGFNLSPDYIEQVVRETWAGIVVGARKAGDLFMK